MAASEQATITIGPYEVVGRPGVEDARAFLARRVVARGPARLFVLTVVPCREADERDLEREVAVCSGLRHPAIARVAELFRWEESYVLATEHVDGVRLARLKTHLEREGGCLPDSAIWYVGTRIAGALARTHMATDEFGTPASLVHGHVTPQRVLVGWDGQVQLVGAALPTLLEHETALEVPDEQSAAFRAPELLAGRRLTPAADVYAVGALLWTLLSGRPPLAAGQRLPSIREFRPDLDESLAQAIDCATEPDPGARRIRCLNLERQLRGLVQITAGKTALRHHVETLRALLGLWSVAPPRPTAPPPARAEPQAPAPARVDDHDHEQRSSDHDALPSPRRALVAPLPPPADQARPGPTTPAPSTPAPSTPAPSRAPSGLSPSMWLALGALLTVGALLVWRLLGDATSAAPAAPPTATDGTLAAHDHPSAAGAPASPPAASAATPAPTPSRAPTARAAGPDAGGAADGEARPSAGDGSDLLTYEGYLVVRSSVDAAVFVQGKHLGPTNTKLRAHCHQRHVRIAALPGPRWLGPGVPVRIACQTVTTVTIEPATQPE